ncbi:4-(cytidine 5'-diphospho)-2-C-methyl-D-erythritol kinase [Williamsia sterculiae]|uniref:4-diphosphocytidyl-2-C-methyl-D-erythritol kinase n=1 Tax=Williamsia sterculiae TaxID=1344003 RepID=A0A1N7DNS2_9NOCA|nr:4-(cytidine 5'-diphospho)-2-C-methyl-D-erythritol kinase [Williamsia sterculiae]SIR77365.1 4-diphosphocytidyl-2-C-methyl-D-erythritol kinase [Williamsia sterculiae]
MLSVVPASAESRPVSVQAPAKVNLFLGVGDLRVDGYHELTTVFQALSLSERIRLSPAETLTISVRGDNAAAVPTDDSNLAARAARALAERCDRDPAVHIDIDKGIPVAGGLAGGSADAAATMVGLDRLWETELSRAELSDIAAELGSDVPFSLHGGTALGTGRGENLMSVLSRGELHWVLAISREGLSTPAVYGELDRLRAGGSAPTVRDPAELLQALAAGDPHRLAPLLHNDLQPAALSMRPTLRRTLRAGTDAGALAGIVSGSGPTCVFLCASARSAVDVAAELSGAGVCSAVRTATGPVSGAHVVEEAEQ